MFILIELRVTKNVMLMASSTCQISMLGCNGCYSPSMQARKNFCSAKTLDLKKNILFRILAFNFQFHFNDMLFPVHFLLYSTFCSHSFPFFRSIVPHLYPGSKGSPISDILICQQFPDRFHHLKCFLNNKQISHKSKFLIKSICTVI